MSKAAGSWKYRLRAYMSALIVPATIRIASVAPTRIWFFRSARSTSGAGTRFSTTTNSTQPTIEITRQPRNAGGEPPPGRALAECEHERNEDHREEDRAEEVDRLGTVRVARLGHLRNGQRDAAGGDRGVDPEEALPAAELDEHAADERPRCGACRRSRAPDRDRAHLRRARRRDRQAGSCRTRGSSPPTRPGSSGPR